ncbi:MAG: chromosomal replication initiator protein DnaA [Actinomycetota bacterium]|nr:chromosomal replication initiator protein DnaA [Actinomycetota bacterium]
MQEQVHLIWEKALGIIRDQLNTPTFKTWFENTSPVALYEGTLIVSTPNSFAKEWLESRYAVLLKQALSQAAGEEVGVKFTVKGPQKEWAKEGVLEEPPKIASPVERVAPAAGYLNPKYTFDSFVIGSSNRFAHAAALAVAEKPSLAYNPLFIYGGVGLGKTHLLQAIARYVLEHHPRLKVKYVSTEKFTTDFINSIRDKDKITGFQKKYRNSDVLLVDDIQFLENKEATQEEFFHTFNTLHEATKQMVISSDRPPKDIATLEDRLRSRFEWGLITDIQAPDLETRIAILSKRVKMERLRVPDEIMELIASRVQSNIRELEGALIRVVAFSSLTKCPITIQLAEDVLKDIFPEKEIKPITIPAIQHEACRYFSISRGELISKKRAQPIVYPRQVAMYLARELTDFSLPKIGKEFGGRDHTTVLHATTKIEKLLNEQREVYNQIQELTNRIKQKR